MNFKIIIAIFLVLFFALPGIAILVLHLNYNSAESIPECRAITIYNNYNYRARLIINFRVHNTEGRIFYEGMVYEDNKKIGLLHRQINFRITRMPGTKGMRGSVHYKGYAMKAFPNDNVSHEVARKFLPPFFLSEDGEIYFDLINTNKGLYLVKDNVPMFFCNPR
ncbi:hypothetical protein AB1287_00600 [Enterobacter asburiae]|uniref:hypothetical protein n=1 Tax=Scandinavium sp. UTDF21-P1B TaxID=3446379 RepID=UPI003473BDBA